MGESKKVKLSPPWITYCHEIEALFKKDPDVTVRYNDDPGPEVKIFVNNEEKADALAKLLPASKSFGNIILAITVVTANLDVESNESLFRRAFKDNPIVKSIAVVDDVYSFSAGYVVFSGDVVQFFNDELSDINGMKTMLYQDIAKDVFSDVGGMFFFCTEQLT